MGNQVVKPYIIDEVESDDEICYDTAPESDPQPRDSDLDDDDLGWLPSDKGGPPGSGQGAEGEGEGDEGSHMSVDAKVVSSLVSNVEELLDHLSNHDYQAAHSAAMLLKSCGIGAGGNVAFSLVCFIA